MAYFTPGANVSERASLPPPLAVSTVLFSLSDQILMLPLVRRVRQPFEGKWALPGGPVRWNQSLTEVAEQTLISITSEVPRHLEQLYTFGDPGRSPAEHLVSIVYWAQLGRFAPRPQSNTEWFQATDLPEMAFDHRQIIDYAVQRLRGKPNLIPGFLEESFTLADLRLAQEAVLGEHLDVANFRRDVLKSGLVEETGEFYMGGSHRPAKLYRRVPEIDAQHR